MEVSETKLVNFAEKTKFDVSNVIEAPPMPGIPGFLLLELRKNKLELLPPDLTALISEDGTWNGTEPNFRYGQLDDNGNPTGVVYNGLAEVPRLSGSTVRDLEGMVENDFSPAFIENFLKTLNSQNAKIENIFQLDPNQLLTVSGGYKEVLRRPLDR